MHPTITTQSLFEAQQSRLSLIWIAGRNGAALVISDNDPQRPHCSLIGNLNVLHPNQIQVLGRWEHDYLSALGNNSRADLIEQLFLNRPAAVIISDDLSVDAELIEAADKADTPLFTTPLPCQKLINQLQYFLSQQLAESTTLHGVFMEVHGLGVLLSGRSAIGKSELALELVNRGHRLIADDAPQFARNPPDAIRGTCPEVLRGFLEVRGLGILNIREMFGDSAIIPAKNLRLIVELSVMSDEEIRNMDRFQGSYEIVTLLDVSLPKVVLPVAPGRNLAVLVETATRQHIQILSGYNAAEDFISKQRQLMDSIES